VPRPPYFAGVDPVVGVAFVDFHFSLRIDSFQIAWVCSSEPLNGLSVPRNLRYSVFVISDMLHLKRGGVVSYESYLELSSELLASIIIRLLQTLGCEFLRSRLPREVWG
jgi:hypothetical protein